MNLNLKEIVERIKKTNEQRMKMMCALVNVMKDNERATIEIRTAVAATMIDMLATDMIDEDEPMIEILNETIDVVCEHAKEYGIEDLRSRLSETIKMAKEIVKEKENRVNEGNEILSNINFNLN